MWLELGQLGISCGCHLTSETERNTPPGAKSCNEIIPGRDRAIEDRTEVEDAMSRKVEAEDAGGKRGLLGRAGGSSWCGYRQLTLDKPCILRRLAWRSVTVDVERRRKLSSQPKSVERNAHKRQSA